MSDSKLRELERRWRDTGDVQDEAAWLKERVRVGDLSREVVELCALCGHEAALLVLPSPSALTRLGTRMWEAVAGKWLSEPLRKVAGHEAAVRAAVAVARLVLPCAEELFPNDPRPSAALRAAESWVRSQSSDHRDAATRARPAASSAVAWDAGSGGGPPAGDARAELVESARREQLAALVACEMCAGATEDARHALDAEGAATVALRFSRGGSYEENRERVRRAIHDEFVPWLLRIDDPVVVASEHWLRDSGASDA